MQRTLGLGGGARLALPPAAVFASLAPCLPPLVPAAFALPAAFGLDFDPLPSFEGTTPMGRGGMSAVW